MNKIGRTAVVVGLLAIGAAGVYYVIAGGSGPTTAQKADKLGTAPSPVTTQWAASLPRLVDLGAGKCIPCKMMAPILEELKKEYAGRLEVEFIDVWVNPEAGKPYGVAVQAHLIVLRLRDGHPLYDAAFAARSAERMTTAQWAAGSVRRANGQQPRASEQKRCA